MFDNNIPKIIHIYNDNKLSKFQTLSINNIKKINKNYVVLLYNKKDVQHILKKDKDILTPHFINKKYNIIEHQYSNDNHIKIWFKFYILNKKGGIWLDINTLNFKNFDNVLETNHIKNNIYGFSSHMNKNLISNYFLISPKNTPIIKEYLREITKAFNNVIKYCEINYVHSTYDNVYEQLPNSIEELVWNKLLSENIQLKKNYILIDKNTPTDWITSFISLKENPPLSDEIIEKCSKWLEHQTIKSLPVFIFLYKKSLANKIMVQWQKN
jgi:hypothetical protein